MVNLERDNNNRIQNVKNEHQRNLDMIEQEWLLKLENEKDFFKQDIDFYKRQVEVCEEKCQDEMLLRRKLEIDTTTEKKKMHSTLEQALSKLQHSQEDTVDRTFVKNLVVTYFRQKRFV